MDRLPDSVTLGKARALLRAEFEVGARCPCCNQHVKLYKRRMNSNMAAALIYLSHVEDGRWIHLKDYLMQYRRYFSDAPQMRWRGLIERKPRGGSDGNPSAGYYRITAFGRSFVRGDVSARTFLYYYNDSPVRRHAPDESTITIGEALGDKFDYQELMRATPDASSPAEAN